MYRNQRPWKQVKRQKKAQMQYNHHHNSYMKAKIESNYIHQYKKPDESLTKEEINTICDKISECAKYICEKIHEWFQEFARRIKEAFERFFEWLKQRQEHYPQLCLPAPKAILLLPAPKEEE